MAIASERYADKPFVEGRPFLSTKSGGVFDAPKHSSPAGFRTQQVSNLDIGQNRTNLIADSND